MVAMRGNAWRALALALAVPAIGAAPAVATDFPVDSSGDGGDVSIDGICDADAGAGVACSLRAALQESNASGGADFITFQANPFNGEAADKITVSGSALPAITSPVAISCATDPASGQPCAEIAAAGFDGLTVSADSVTITDVAVTGANQAITGLAPVERFRRRVRPPSHLARHPPRWHRVGANTTGVFLDPGVGTALDRRVRRARPAT